MARVKFDPSVPLRFVGDLFVRNLPLKLVALLLTAVLFVLTRDEVTRTFEVPLQSVQPDDRVLLTDLPDSIKVQVRGPWTRVNRLQDYDFGIATLDLQDAEPGPLKIDEGAIVMPSGVVLSDIDYDQVDLRFEPVISAEVPITPQVIGVPQEDYKLVQVVSEPGRWTIKGGRSDVQAVQQLTTEPLSIDGATQDVEKMLAIVEPSGSVKLVGADDGTAEVEVRAEIQPSIESRDFTVPVPVPPALDRTGVIPRTYSVQVTGPTPDFRELERLGIAFPVEADVVPMSETAGGNRLVEIRFRWAETVPKAVSDALDIDHGVVRVSLPAPAPEVPADPGEP